MKHRYEMRGQITGRFFGTAVTEFYAIKVARFMCESEPVEVYDKTTKKVIRVLYKTEEIKNGEADVQVRL